MAGEAESNPIDLKATAVLRRRDRDRKYGFVVRWSLDGTGKNLPTPEHLFRIRVTAVGGKLEGKELDNDGVSFVAPADARSIEAKPRPLAMIDPPRDASGIAIEPKKAIRRLAEGESQIPPDEGFGIVHLLEETREERLAMRAKSLIEEHLYSALASDDSQLFSTASWQEANHVEETARALSSFFLGSNVRPSERAWDLKNRVESLHNYTRMAFSGESTLSFEEVPEKLRFLGMGQASGFSTIEQAWERMALLSRMFAQPEVLSALDSTIHGPRELKEQMRLRGLQGGTLLDYWSETDREGEARDDTERGQIYPFLELVGLGIEVGSFSEQQIGEWHQSEQQFLIQVELVKPGRCSIQVPIDKNCLRHAVQTGSSSRPFPPRGAQVIYDRVTTHFQYKDRIPPEKELEKASSYGTGESRIQIAIDPPRWEEEVPRNIMGYNVYAVWDDYTDRTRKFFEPEDYMPGLEELRSWLVTRRYSLISDLQGAFPDTEEGKVHPGLMRALLLPPWQPLLDQRGITTYHYRECPPDDKRDDDEPESPLKPIQFYDPVLADKIVWNFDLRTGMRGSEKAGLVAWEPRGYRALEWRPDRQRPQQSGDPALTEPKPVPDGRPQRYRFFVTSVDVLDQESEPVPVKTNDEAAGEMQPRYAFSPRWRAPLSHPRLDEKQSLFIEGGEADPLLRVEWETPRYPMFSGVEQPEYPPNEHLVSDVAVFRRKLTAKDWRPEPAGFVAQTMETAPAEQAVFATPPWNEVRENLLAKEGFTEVLELRRPGIAVPDGVSRLWSTSFPLLFKDRGYEYRVAVGFRVRDEAGAFWFPNVEERKVWIAQEPSPGSDIEPKSLREFSRVSAVAVTESRILHNQLPARLVRLDLTPGKNDFFQANPILAIPGLDRDLVLAKLLKLPSDRDQPVVANAFPAWDSGLTAGQIAMIETALLRTTSSLSRGGIQVSPENVATLPELEETRRILAADFSSMAAGDMYRQHTTIGFRGMQLIKWSYTSFSTVEPQVARESEAVLARVYQARAPQGKDLAHARALTWFVATRIPGEALVYRASSMSKEQVAQLDGLAARKRPVLGRVQRSGDPKADVFYGILRNVSVTEGDSSRALELVPAPDSPLERFPDEADISLFTGNAIHQEALEPLDSKTPIEGNVLLPVGGGHAERFCWWVCGVSVLNLESDNLTEPHAFFMQSFAPSITPSPPSMFSVFPPIDNNAEGGHFLSPSDPAHSAWIPSVVRTDEYARNTPRLVVAWQPYEEEVGILIERNQRALADQKKRGGVNPFSEEISPWEAISEIGRLGETDVMRSECIKALCESWLVGKAVGPDDPTGVDEPSPTGDHYYVRAQQPMLSGTGGLKRIPRLSEGDTAALTAVTAPRVTELAAFIDYCASRHPGPESPIFDGNFEYQYRLRAYIDLRQDTNTFSFISQDPDFYYLLSAPSNWSPSVTPGTGPIDVQSSMESQDEEAPYARPRALLKIIAHWGDGFSTFVSSPPREWWFQALVQRKRYATLRTKPGVKGPDPGWKDIGGPVILDRRTPSVVIEDNELERIEYGSSQTLSYRVVVSQLTKETATGSELPVRTRTTKEFDIVFPEPTTPAKEVQVKWTISVQA